jgi:hypothetical protein
MFTSLLVFFLFASQISALPVPKSIWFSHQPAQKHSSHSESHSSKTDQVSPISNYSSNFSDQAYQSSVSSSPQPDQGSTDGDWNAGAWKERDIQSVEDQNQVRADLKLSSSQTFGRSDQIETERDVPVELVMRLKEERSDVTPLTRPEESKSQKGLFSFFDRLNLREVTEEQENNQEIVEQHPKI